MEDKEKEIFPSLEEWQKLYDTAIDFKEIAPWHWMWDSDVFGIQNPENREIGYCCVLGRNKEVFGLAIYLGTEGLETYLKIEYGQINLKDPDLLYEKRCLLATFEDKEYLSEDDLEVIKKLGLQFSGKNAWPQFRSYQPGYFPWQLTKNEAVYLTLCLKQAKEICLRFKDSPDMLQPVKFNHYFTRIAKREERLLKWEDAWLEPVPLRKMVIIQETIDKNLLERIRQLKRYEDMVWEVDFFYAPAYVAEKNRRPYFPVVFLWVDKYSHFIFSIQMSHPEKYRVGFIERSLKAFESAKILPKEIQVRKEELLVYLQPVAKQLGIRIRLVKKLRAIEDARKSMKEFFNKGK